MARLTANHEGGAAFHMQCRGHHVRVDQPADNGGNDSAMTPPELFAASLAGCVGYYVANYCNQASISTEGLQVSCDWDTADKPKRIGEVAIRVTLPGMPASRRKAVERVASSCLLHTTLKHPPQMSIEIE